MASKKKKNKNKNKKKNNRNNSNYIRQEIKAVLAEEKNLAQENNNNQSNITTSNAVESQKDIGEKIHEVIKNFDSESVEKKEVVDIKIKSSLDKKIHDSIMNFESENADNKEKTLDEKIHDSINSFEKKLEEAAQKALDENEHVEDNTMKIDISKLSKPEEIASNSASQETKVMSLVASEMVSKEKINSEVSQETKASADKKTDKPEYVKEMLEKKNKRTRILITCVTVVAVVSLFSTMFAVSRSNNNTIVSKTAIKNIDVAGLNMDDAKKTLEEKLGAELSKEVTLKYSNDYNVSFTPAQIEFKYNVDDALSKAYAIGRNGNIVSNNYAILGAMLVGNKIDLEYTYNEDLLNKIIDDLSAKIPGVVVEPNYYIEGAELVVEKGKDGIQVKKSDLKEEIFKRIIERNEEEISKEDFKQNIDVPVEDAKASKINMAKIYEEIHTEPKDAYFTTEPYNIFPDQDGIDLAITVEEAQKSIGNEEKTEYTFPLKISKAAKTINDLGMEAFPYEVSSFSTKYDASNINRSTNLAIAANKINGKVLMPGEEFSYNKVVGKRTVEEGYKDAKIYADGGVVDGLAGGICQISSTLYNAALLANLEITERRNHSYPTSYLPVGRDATVVYGVIDLKFKNTRKFPIKIEASVKNGVASFVIHGIKEEKEYEIKILPTTTATLGHGTQTIPDPTLPAGHQVVKQSGHAGYKVTTYIEKTCDGETKREVLSNDTYQPMATIIRVGTAAPVDPTAIPPQ
ncbi:MAG: VanW family protein [Clostridia bacterium]|nr:VanW family protein [Clostridia bacterium]